MSETNYFGNERGSDRAQIDRIFNNATGIISGVRDVVHEVRGFGEDSRRYNTSQYGGGNAYPGYTGYTGAINVPYGWGNDISPRGYQGNRNNVGYPGISDPNYGKGGGRY